MKKIILSILVLVTIISTSACKKSTEDNTQTDSAQEQQEKSFIKKAETAVSEFLDCICDFDIEGAQEYIYDSGELPEIFTSVTALDNFTEDTLKQFPEDLIAYKDDFSELLDSAVDGISESFSYKIISSEKVEKSVIVTTEFIYPDENYITKTTEKIEENIKNQIQLIAEKAIEEGKLTASSSEDDAMDIIMPELFDYLNTYVKDFTKNMETKSASTEFTVEKRNGKRVIISLKTD